MSNEHHYFDESHPTISGVKRPEKLYRIVDFFSAAQAIATNTLYVPLASTFDDGNEAIDAAVKHLAFSVGPCAGMASHFSTVDDFIQYQKSATQQNYVSCWTKTKESVAMWALYSKDFTSVQLSTTVANLERAAITLSEAQSDPDRELSTSAGSGQI